MTETAFPKELLTNSTPLDEASFYEYAKDYPHKREVRKQLTKISEKFVRSLFSQDKNIDVGKACIFCRTLESLAQDKHDAEGYAANIAFYVKTLLSVDEQITENNLQGCFYTTLTSEHRAIMEHILDNTQEKCAQNEHLFTSQLISGMCYSFTGRRQEAQSCFERAVVSGSEFIDTAFLDFGAYSYSARASKTPPAEIDILGESQDLPASPIVLFSVDEHYLRRFFPYLLWTAQSMKEVHFHVHVTAPLSKKDELYNECLELEWKMKSFFKGSKKKGSTFSFDSLPEGIGQPKTYYACSRYLVAEQLMRKMNRDIYIMDADLAIEDDMTTYLEKLQASDVCLPMARGLRALPPWRRFQAGNVFIKNNDMGKAFLSLVIDNMNSELFSSKTWMLDQNSLSYAYDNAPEGINVANIFKSGIKRPTTQPPFLKLVKTQ